MGYKVLLETLSSKLQKSMPKVVNLPYIMNKNKITRGVYLKQK